MKQWQNDSWKKFNEEAAGKDVILYGAGFRCKNSLSLLKLCYNILFIVDRDPEKWGKDILGIRIESPQKLNTLKKDTFIVLITVQDTFEIVEELEKRNIINYYSEFWMSNFELYKEIRIGFSDSKDNLNYLADEKSKKIYQKIMEKRKNAVIDYSDIMDTNEYFRQEFFQPCNGAVYVDAGAFNGDTIEKFIKFNSDFEKIYAFEADKKNYEQLKKSFIYQGFKKKIKIYNYGVYNESATVEFNGEIGISSNIVNEQINNYFEKKVTHIRCVKIDDIIKEKVTFIKMDIEGSEIKALEGAKNTISKYKPNLAICIYHKTDDLWKIPDLIHKMVPEYQLYIRHHSCIFYDTVLYAKL